MSWHHMGSVSRSSTVCGQFPTQGFVDESRLANLTKARCKHIEQFIGVTCTMAMNDGNHVSISGVSAPSGESGELIAMGQLGMAIDPGGQRTMPTGGARSSIGGRLSGTQVEAVMGAWMVRLLYWALQGVGKARGEDGVPLSCQTTTQSSS